MTCRAGISSFMSSSSHPGTLCRSQSPVSPNINRIAPVLWRRAGSSLNCSTPWLCRTNNPHQHRFSIKGTSLCTLNMSYRPGSSWVAGKSDKLPRPDIPHIPQSPGNRSNRCLPWGSSPSSRACSCPVLPRRPSRDWPHRCREDTSPPG